MQAILRLASVAAATVVLAGCENFDNLVENPEEPGPVNVIDATNLNELMLTVADPDDAVEYFRNALAQDPDRIEFRRGYAKSLSRAGKHAEASLVYQQLVTDGKANSVDRLGYAESLARNNAWDEVGSQLSALPDNPNSYRVNLLRAMYSDQKSDWAAADRYYETARRLTPRPANVLNNWGVSKMSRGDLVGAEDAFTRAISFDPTLFNAKNNLVISRGLQDKFSLPVIPASEEERAQLYHNLALIALRKDEIPVARGLLEEAIAAHPRHFDAAVAKLAAIQAQVRK